MLVTDCLRSISGSLLAFSSSGSSCSSVSSDSGGGHEHGLLYGLLAIQMTLACSYKRRLPIFFLFASINLFVLFACLSLLSLALW